MILQSVFSIFSPVLPCPLGLGELQACPFPDVVFPPLLLCALSSSPFHCSLQHDFGQTWWTGDMTIPLQFASLHDRQVFVRSSYLLDLGTNFLVGNMIFVWDRCEASCGGTSFPCILLWSSAVRVHDSQAYRKMDVTRERTSRILAVSYTHLTLPTRIRV